MDFHGLATYQRRQLGPYPPRSGVALPLSGADEAFFAETLRRAKKYRDEEMVFDAAVAYPPQAVVAAANSRTPLTWLRPAPGAPFSFGDAEVGR